MKKYLLIIVLFSILAPAPILAADCPLGQVDDHAPGLCGLYNDTDENAICDLSESNLTSCSADYSKSAAEETAIKNIEPNRVNHYFGLITIILVLGYLAGLLAVAKQKLSVIKHRKIWNWLLLILFFPTALSSILLAVIIEYGWTINLGVDLSYWHYVFGWAFLLVSVFHIAWHSAYYYRLKK